MNFLHLLSFAPKCGLASRVAHPFVEKPTLRPFVILVVKWNYFEVPNIKVVLKLIVAIVVLPKKAQQILDPETTHTTLSAFL